MRKGAGRPRLGRRINFDPRVTYFKPRGLPLSGLQTVDLSKEELEALRLKNLEVLDQRECAEKMQTSPATLQRILAAANRKVTLALVEGRAIRIVD